VRLLADVNIGPRTVERLRSLGHDVVRVGEVLMPTASDREIIEYARDEDRAVLTQDLDLTTIVALSGGNRPSVITLRLPSARIESVNAILEAVLPALEEDVTQGIVATIEEGRIRRRSLPIP
jgi:predicted nuclease of predicted toxin-antitoxin system